MEFKPKSAIIKIVAGGFLALFLSGCEDMGLPHVFGGSEVPEDVLQEPRVVKEPTAQQEEEATWPRLGDVPSKPKNFSSETTIQKSIFDMQEDRAEGQEDMRRYEEEKATAPIIEVAPETLPQSAPPQQQ